MSDYKIGIVVEGPTDRIIIESALNHIFQDQSYTMIQLQPEQSFNHGGFGATGSGWGGVYRWCRQVVDMGFDISENPSLKRFDIIIIHLDADVSEKKYSDANIFDPINDDLPCVLPCPPASNTTKKLEYGQNDNNILVEIECNADIENYLAQKPARERFIRNRKGKMRKITKRYAEYSGQITKKWNFIIEQCSQAKEFNDRIIDLKLSKQEIA
ncbi:MAG: hypothetical protein HQK75_18730 [Candidatus Magnetomorum sp.]|nr:hypothetical protein [Candidatus Magnetomorum sp.]